ncbi:hypothetical protein WJX73_003184 [Symbiochloris irregularis]|uniref:Dynein heavy chain linker domain-containing protein n=1 Tax=Symbiochloris irregularis TaxID=706552 RepID=A0AAW1NTD0_9CHLO
MISAVRPSSEDIGPGFEYLRQLHDYLDNEAASGKFLYLKRVNAKKAYNPYMLKVVPYTKADTHELYTLSAKGVAVSRGDVGSSDITPCLQWEHEARVFNELKKKALFRNFQLFKPFRTWQRVIRLTKMQAVGDRLKQSFILLEHTQGGLAAVVSHCAQVCATRLQALQPGQPQALARLQDRASSGLISTAIDLRTTIRDIIDSLVTACQLDMDHMHQRLDDFMQQQGEVHAAVSSGMSLRGTINAGTLNGTLGTTSTSLLSASHTLQDFSFTLGASDRNEMRLLLRYVRLADLMVLNALREMMQASLSNLLLAMTSSPAPSPASEAAASDVGRTVQPCIQLQLSRGEAQELQLSPAFQEVQTFLGSLLQSWAQCISQLPRVADARKLAMYIHDAPELTPLASLMGIHFLADLPDQLQGRLEQSWQQAVAAGQVIQPLADAALPEQVEAGPFLIKLDALKADLGSIPSIHLAKLFSEIPKMAAGLASHLSMALHRLVRTLTQTAESPAQYVCQLSLLTALEGGAEHQIQRSCREVEELHALIKAEGMALSDADRSSFLLASSDLEHLQEAVTAARAGHAQQNSHFAGLLADEASAARQGAQDLQAAMKDASADSSGEQDADALIGSQLKLWQTVRDWKDVHATWLLMPVAELNVQSMTAQLKSSLDSATELDGLLGSSQVVNVRMSSLLQFEGTPQAAMILAASKAATLEAGMRQRFEGTLAEAQALTLPLQQGQHGAWMLGDASSVAARLDLCLAALGDLLSSGHAKEISSEVTGLRVQLLEAQELLELMEATQRQLSMLAGLLKAPALTALHPQQAKQVTGLERRARQRLRDARAQSRLLNVASTAGLLQAVRQDHSAAMAIPSQLSDYVDTRRAVFPRFSLLSNEALLALMACCTDGPIAAVQSHITAMFPGIGALEALGEAGKTEEIHAVISPEGERLALTKGVKVQGDVEAWLGKLEAAVEQTMRRAVRTASRPGSLEGAQDGLQLLLQVPVQAAIVGAKIQLCRKIEAALSSPDPAKQLGDVSLHGAIVTARQLIQEAAGDANHLAWVGSLRQDAIGHLLDAAAVGLGASSIADQNAARDFSRQLAAVQTSLKAGAEHPAAITELQLLCHGFKEAASLSQSLMAVYTSEDAKLAPQDSQWASRLTSQGSMALQPAQLWFLLDPRAVARLPAFKLCRQCGMQQGSKASPVSSSRMEVLSLYPEALSSEQLWGSFAAGASQWRDGLVSAFLRKASVDDSFISRVLVLKGQLPAALVELVAKAVSNMHLGLPNGDQIALRPKRICIVLEGEDHAALPAPAAGQLSLICLSASNFGWRDLARQQPSPAVVAIGNMSSLMQGLLTQLPMPASSEDSPTHLDLWVPTETASCVRHLTEAWLAGSRGVLLRGPCDCGKSRMLQEAVQRLCRDKSSEFASVLLDKHTTVSSLQAALQANMQRLSRGRLGPKTCGSTVILLEDLASADASMQQALLHLIQQKGFHSTEAPYAWQDLTNCTFIATSTTGDPHTAALHSFACVSIPATSQASVCEMVTKALQLAFEGSNKGVIDASIPLARATAAIWDQAPRVLPTYAPSGEHYNWSLQDVFRLIQGMMQTEPAACTSGQQLYNAWLHVAFRVWGDQLVDKHDLAAWRKLLARVLTTHWPATLAPADILRPRTYAKLPADSSADAQPAGYCEVTDLTEAAEAMRKHLGDSKDAALAGPSGLLQPADYPKLVPGLAAAQDKVHDTLMQRIWRNLHILIITGDTPAQQAEQGVSTAAKLAALCVDLHEAAVTVHRYSAPSASFTQLLHIPDWTLPARMSAPSQVHQWHAWGLPEDSCCVDNAITITCSQKPVLLDLGDGHLTEAAMTVIQQLLQASKSSEPSQLSLGDQTVKLHAGQAEDQGRAALLAAMVREEASLKEAQDKLQQLLCGPPGTSRVSRLQMATSAVQQGQASVSAVEAKLAPSDSESSARQLVTQAAGIMQAAAGLPTLSSLYQVSLGRLMKVFAKCLKQCSEDPDSVSATCKAFLHSIQQGLLPMHRLPFTLCCAVLAGHMTQPEAFCGLVGVRGGQSPQPRSAAQAGHADWGAGEHAAALP